MTALKGALSDWVNLYRRGLEYSLKAVIIGEPDVDQAFDKAVEDLATGKQPFGLFSFFKGGLKAKVEAVRIEGRLPANAEDWASVHGYRLWRAGATPGNGRVPTVIFGSGRPGDHSPSVRGPGARRGPAEAAIRGGGAAANLPRAQAASLAQDRLTNECFSAEKAPEKTGDYLAIIWRLFFSGLIWLMIG